MMYFRIKFLKCVFHKSNFARLSDFGSFQRALFKSEKPIVILFIILNYFNLLD